MEFKTATDCRSRQATITYIKELVSEIGRLEHENAVLTRALEMVEHVYGDQSGGNISNIIRLASAELAKEDT